MQIRESLSNLQIFIKNLFLLNFPHDVLMYLSLSTFYVVNNYKFVCCVFAATFHLVTITGNIDSEKFYQD